MKVGVLGPLVVVTDAGPVVIGAPKERAVLTLLALRAGASVSQDELIDALWGDSPPRSARKAVQTYVSGLRRHLPSGVISTTAAGYRLSGADVDVERFEGLVREGGRLTTAGQLAAATSALTEALGLWRGPPLPDLSDQPRGSGEAVRLAELFRLAQDDLADLWLADGRHDSLIPALEAAVGAEPLRERRWGQLMLALYRAGRQSDALRAYQRVRRVLGEELGVSPNSALVELEQAILAQDPALRPVAPHPLGGTKLGRPKPGHGTVGDTVGLPVAANAFIGREMECDAVAALLHGARLVTIIGSGGAGKTRLALEVANASRARFADGVVLVRLAPIGEAAVVSHVAAAFAVEAEPDQPQIATLVAALAGRHVLVVLDNCEHVIDAAAEVAETLVSSCGRVSVLATSREALRCPSERRFQLGQLPRPSAAALFVERAESARGGALDPSELVSVDEICHRLDGLPLALEIAAARCQALRLGELAGHLEDHRLSLMGLRTSEDRHQSLWAAIEWSYCLLTESEQRLFRRLSVFAGGATYPEVQAFSAPGDVATLVDKSLVVHTVEAGARGADRPRLAMHETVRQFAADLLSRAGEETEAGRDHAQVYLALAEAEGGKVRGRDQLSAIARLGAEQDNLSAAISWGLLSGNADIALRFGRALWWYWFRSGQAAQGRASIESALGLGSGDPGGEARAAAGYLAWDTDNFDVAIVHATSVLASQSSSFAARSLALGVLARVYGDQGDSELAGEAAEDSQRLYEMLGLAWFVAWARRCRASVALWGGNAEAAQRLTADALAGFEAVGDDWAIVGCIDLMAITAMRLGDTPTALTLAADSVARHRQFEDWSGTRAALLHLAEVAEQAGDVELSRSAAAESLALAEDHGFRLGALHAHLLLGRLAVGTGDRPSVELHARSAAALARQHDGREAVLDATADLLAHAARLARDA